MRIAVNTRLLLPDKLEGIGWFAHETLSRIVKAHPEHRFLFIFDRKPDQRFLYAPNVEAHVLWPPTRHPLLYVLWFEFRLPRLLRRLKADAFISTDGYLSTRAAVPQLGVMHDLNFEHYPQDLPRSYSRYYRKWFPRFARKAKRLVTVSDFSKQDIHAQYGVALEKIDVAHNGVADAYSPCTIAEQMAVRSAIAGGDPYFICVGSLQPRKNIARLLLAFDALVEADAAPLKLVIAGDAFWWDARMKAAWVKVQHKDRVVFTGRLGQQALRNAIGGALGLAYVSYFEGFGIPVAEAMKCGVPVLAADATSLPEVAGEAAVYCDPFNVASITEGLSRLRNDAVLREHLSTAGIERARQFTWDNTARQVWASFERMMATPPR
ncbi:MAG: glycosyltransferase family 1 protein [Flavobacteriales bacterium]